MRRDSLSPLRPTRLSSRRLPRARARWHLLSGWPRQGGFWLGDVTIILPTRRARLAPGGGVRESSSAARRCCPISAPLAARWPTRSRSCRPSMRRALRPAASQLERRLTLSHLVRLFAEQAGSFANPPNAAEIFWLADSLGEVLDDLTVEGIAAERLTDLGAREPRRELAADPQLPRRGAEGLAGDPQRARQDRHRRRPQRAAGAAGRCGRASSMASAR